jgi:alkylation response protein AidB-like acyl-CoA dehydrogenase
VTPKPVDTARELYELVDRNARAAAPTEPVSDETVKALVDAGLHAVMVPKEVGGGEAPIVECIDAIAEVSRADGSAGWCLMANAATIAFFGAWGGDDFARDLFAHGVPLAAGQFAPNGTATPDAGGYRISGDYNFGSGINHSDWIGAGVLTAEEDSRLLMALMPRDAVSFADGWDVLGLEATASWDYTVRDAWVPEGATFDFFAPVQHRGGAVYQLGVLGLTSAGHAGVAIGVVRRALDELRAIATTKARMGATAPLREKESFLVALASLESRARAAACWVRDTFATAEATATRTGSADPGEVALARQSTVHATQDGAALVRDAYLLAGTDALRAGPLQRCFRDMHAASQHFFAGEFASLEAGRALLSDPGLSDAGLSGAGGHSR